ncbi:MAG: hypothetical protein RBT61_09355 [Candidatus Kapabacteria bacterium]|nr:hypothetical protein [Candidatus Kapabacteria bacterium]
MTEKELIPVFTGMTERKFKSFPRKRESTERQRELIPVFTGMTKRLI